VIYHFITRDTISGGVLGADQKISRKEALRVETINNAYLTFEERIRGSIEPGKARRPRRSAGRHPQLPSQAHRADDGRHDDGGG